MYILSVNSLLIIISYLISSIVHKINGFWLTDMSLFQPIAQVNETNQLTANLLKGIETSTWQNLVLDSSELNISNINNIRQAKVEKQKNEDEQQQQQQQQQRQQSQGNSQFDIGSTANIGVCQCDLNWLRNETSHLLNKWLSSNPTQYQLRSLLQMSNSTGATRSTFGQLANNNINNYLRRRDPRHPWTTNEGWVRSTNKRTTASSYSNGITDSIGSSSRTGSSGSSSGSSAKLLRGEPGPQGPKGEQGARGDKGEAGLISVDDREALFSLDSSKRGSRRQLVFIESEQMLVMSTDSGWRPVQLASSPLMDIKRNNKAKFSLNSEETRRKLLLIDNLDSPIGGEGSLNGAKPLSGDVKIVDIGNSDVTMPKGGPNKIKAVNNNNNISDDFVEDDEDDDEEDDEDEEDEFDEFDENDDEDRDEFEDDLDDDDDESDANVKVVVSSGKDNRRLEEKNEIQADDTNELRQERKSIVRTLKGPSKISSPNGSQMMMRKVSQNHISSDLMLPRSSANKSARKVPIQSDRRMKLRLIALNEPFSGNVHGIRGADFECKRQASRFHVKGTFKAFLASNIQSLNELVRLNVHRDPIVNLRGETLANSWHDFLKLPARFVNPLSRIYSFDGRHVASDSNWPNKLVWHGAVNKFGLRDPINNCDGWHSDSLNKFGSASPIHIPRTDYNLEKHQGNTKNGHNKRQQKKKRYLDTNTKRHAPNETSILDAIDKYPCKMPLILLCIETVSQAIDETKSKLISSEQYDRAVINNI